MRKITIHIFIIAVLVIFSPIFRVNASTSNPSEPCKYDAGGSVVNAPCNNYHLLAPLTDVKDFNPAQDNALGTYLNGMIQIFIGLCAVLAVVMIVIGGLQYMTSELISSKEEGKKRIQGALLGLLIALGAYALLYTINPNLLNTDFKIPDATVSVIQEFQVSGAQSSSFSGQPIKVNFNRQAYPAANIASGKTGVDTALILAVFAQESGSGANTGRCHWTDSAANMIPADRTALQTITGELKKDINDTPVSCAIKTSSGSFDGNGGAIGYTQFRPATWLENRNEAAGYLGHMPNPWNVDDALMMTSVYLKKLGAVNNQQEAACKYFAGPARSCSSSASIGNYGNSTLGKKLSIEKQIADAKKKGDIN